MVCTYRVQIHHITGGIVNKEEIEEKLKSLEDLINHLQVALLHLQGVVLELQMHQIKLDKKLSQT